MPRVFLSHAHQDKAAIRQIVSALAESGFEPWLDEAELRSGDELLAEIARVLQEVELFCVALTPVALTKPWVLAETRMALTSEIERGSPRVVALLLEDCEVPAELRHKLYIDFRGRFDSAIAELRKHLAGVKSAPPIPKQAVIAAMIREADDELWTRLTAGAGSKDDWSRPEFADLVHGLTSRELEGAVVVGARWSGKHYKWWENHLVKVLTRATGATGASSKRLLQGLIAKGFLEPATDLDYGRGKEAAWCDTSALWILRRAARRSGLFANLPPPIPERLSGVLAYERSLSIISKGWYAIRFVKPVKTVLEPNVEGILAVVRYEPPTTWVFRSEDDRDPLHVEKSYGLTELTPSDPLASLQDEDRDQLTPGFDLFTFDDLGVLT